MAGGSLLSILKFTPARTDTTVILSLPSSLEKGFNKIPYSKGLSFLTKTKKIDFCLLFVVSKRKLKDMFEEIQPYLKADCILWIAFPKKTSKIITDLKKNEDWEFMSKLGYDKIVYIAMDGVWSALRFSKVDKQEIEEWQKVKRQVDLSAYIDDNKQEIKSLHPYLEKTFEEHSVTYEFFKTLTFEEQKNYLYWVHMSDKEVILKKRIQDAIAKMNEGILNPFFSS